MTHRPTHQIIAHSSLDFHETVLYIAPTENVLGQYKLSRCRANSHSYCICCRKFKISFDRLPHTMAVSVSNNKLSKVGLGLVGYLFELSSYPSEFNECLIEQARDDGVAT